MPSFRPRFLFVLLGAFLAVWLALHALAYSLRERPNYSRIDDGLYMGGNVPEPPPGVDAVLNLCEDADPYRCEINLWVPIRDGTPAPRLDWLRRRVAFVDEQRRAGRTVYVHCHAGVSRSGMVVVAYFMWKNNWTRDQALAFVRTRREQVRPNPAFMELLVEWEGVVRAQAREQLREWRRLLKAPE